MGAAYLAGLASDVWGSMEEIQNLWKGDDPFLPDFNNPLSEKLYENWLEAVSKSKN